MSLKNINKESGFTIVELLIVIVVIGILAAITIVAYNGVQNRARTTSAQAAAQEVQNKAEVYAADTGNGVFIATSTAFKALATTDTASISPGTKALMGTALPTSATPTVLMYQQCQTNGAKVAYWDSTAGAVVYLYMGAATSATTCAAAA
jgi:prepilin-type N-terminal cleavage/methylation domain-containing protein